MVGHLVLVAAKKILTYEPQPIQQIAKKLKRESRNAYPILYALQDLELVEQVDLPHKDRHDPRKGWRLKR